MSDRATPTVLIDNERVRVTRWSFAAGAATGWHVHEYDYVIVNDVIADSLSILRGVLSAERHRASRQTGLPGFARELQQGLKSQG